MLLVGPKYAYAAVYFAILLCDYSDLYVVSQYLSQRIPDFYLFERYWPKLFFESILAPLIEDYCC